LKSSSCKAFWVTVELQKRKRDKTRKRRATERNTVFFIKKKQLCFCNAIPPKQLWERDGQGFSTGNKKLVGLRRLGEVFKV
jgi:hypothetical protein